ncbi:MAG: methionine adenosyltransferase [candidate division WOR-3 bacterium]
MVKVEKMGKWQEDGFEIVERKGIGHPDTICDSLSEEFSKNLSKLYYETFGRILHHNVDKAILVGGRAEPKFGGGKVLEPIYFSLVGRLTYSYKGLDITPKVKEIFYNTVEDWIKENIPNLNPDKHLEIELRAKPGSIDLVDLFDRNGQVPLSNDTSFGVGFYPFSNAEKIALSVEKFLNSKEYKRKYPAVGEDIKVMVVRNGSTYNITVALAFVDRYVSSLKDYLELKGAIRDDVLSLIGDIVSDGKIDVSINTADDEENGSVYITVTGTSAEAGDDGQVGRGNRVNGLITPYRPMTLEAAAGKNPVSHVGKLYNIMANIIAREIYEGFEGVEQVYVYLVSQIGKPVNQPQLVHLKVWGDYGENTLRDMEDLALAKVNEIPRLWEKIVFENIAVC